MLWVYEHHKYFYFYSAGIDFRCQNLTSLNVRFWDFLKLFVDYFLFIDEKYFYKITIDLILGL